MSRTGRHPARAPGAPGPPTGAAPAAALSVAAAALGAGLLVLGVATGESPGSADTAGIYLDGPPPGHTGGFDEPTCRACHFDRPLDPEGGDVRLDGVPDRWAADSVYDLRVVLTHEAMERAGFQLAARWRDGERAGCSAGDLAPAGGGRTQAVAARDSAAADGGCRVVYVQHTERGTGPDEDGAARWRVRWRAPDGKEPAGPVAFHVAANAANDDASEFGDRIYAAEAVSRPEE